MSHGDRVTALPPGFEVVGALGERALRGDRRRGAALLRDPVPSRGRPHAGRREAPRELRPPHRRLRRRLDDGRLPRPGDRAHPRAGRQGQRDLRPLRRRRLGGRRGADPRGDRRPAHLHLRRPRPDAPGRGGGGRRPLPRPLQHPAGPRRRAATRSSTRSPASPTRRRSARPSAGCSSTSSRRRRRRSAAPISSRRARSIPT